MKKIMFLFLAISAMLLSGCSKDEPKEEPVSILGSWKHEFVSGFTYTHIYTFKKDGTGTIDYHRTGDSEESEINEIYHITYSINGNKLTINEEEEDEVITYTLTIISITEKTLTLENDENKQEILHKVN